MNIHSPVVIIPDLVNNANYFVMDFGKISVGSKVVQEAGRWVNFEHKLIYLTKYFIDNRDMKFEYHTTNKVDTVFNEDTVGIEVAMVNASPYLVEPKGDKPNIFDLN